MLPVIPTFIPGHMISLNPGKTWNLSCFAK